MTLDERFGRLNREVVGCRRCPRLVAWREQVAREKRAAFRDQDYWGRPVPGFGDPAARLLVLGLAPAAHGGNRTGRIFTGDRSGDWLFGSLHRTGFANQPTSVSRDDGLALRDCYITAPVKCAPPDNKPLPEERDNCQPWLRAELALLPALQVVVALGAFAWDQALRQLGPVRPRPRFGHAAEAALPAGPTLLGSYHVSQQNTSTRRLTEEMLDGVFWRARELLDRHGSGDRCRPR
jgi:uracil-DNA glycosylase